MNKFKEELKVNAENFVKRFYYINRAKFIKEQKQKKEEKER